MIRLGVPELIIVLVIVILLFGGGRLSKIAGELGSGIRVFRNGLKGKDSESNGGDVEKKSKDQEG